MASRKITDPVFGVLKWDGKLRRWSGTAALTPKHTVRVCIHDVAANRPSEEELVVCRHTFQKLRENEYGHRLRTAESLVETYNDWRQGDEPEETAGSFALMFALEAIDLYPDGNAELWYDAHRFFGGHAVNARIDEDGAFIEATMG